MILQQQQQQQQQQLVHNQTNPMVPRNCQHLRSMDFKTRHSKATKICYFCGSTKHASSDCPMYA
ncbi:hypothetical protein PS15p_201438 [Mucor circinelloides]